MQRHRNPANGYRPNPIGIGGGGGGGGAAGGYRNYNRGGFGRGQPPPPRRIDVFMEAGKLATEYLVSKGLLPPNSLNAKWQNSNLKNQIGDGVSDAVSGRRRFPDDYSSATASKDGTRARRTTGSFKNPGIELNREINRSSSWSEKVKGSSNKQGDGDSFSESMEEQRSGKDGANEDQKSVSGDLESKSYDAGNSNTETTTVNQQNQSPEDNTDAKTPISEEESDDLKNINTSTDDVVMDDGIQESEKPDVKEDPPEENINNIAANIAANNNSSDLLSLIRFNKVPTRTRSSMTLKGSKSDPVLISGDENRNKQDDEKQESDHEQTIQQDPSEDDHKYKFGQGLHTRSQSLPQKSSISEQELLSEGQHDGYARGEKRPLQIEDTTEAVKKSRSWTSADPQGDDYLHLSSSRDQSSSQEGRSRITQHSYTEEKQFFPSSFKICDLNLMGVSDVNENRDTNSVIGFSSVGQEKQEPVSVDFDLSMNSSSCDIANRHITCGPEGNKGVEVIDLDCDSVQDDNNNSERREEAIFTDLESFPDSIQRVSDLPQDGYGLMISELLEADIPNSSVTTGVNSMHNEMSLPSEEEILGDDESIYMSLGEIPISFVPVWDQQPSQGYDKRY